MNKQLCALPKSTFCIALRCWHGRRTARTPTSEGESTYFLENAEQQIMGLHGEKPLMVAWQKCISYTTNYNYKNAIATYEAEREYIGSFARAPARQKHEPQHRDRLHQRHAHDHASVRHVA